MNTDGKIQAWLVGCIFYFDQFKHEYKTKFVWNYVDPATNKGIRFEPGINTTVSGQFAERFNSLE
jgi:hypothetical protein